MDAFIPSHRRDGHPPSGITWGYLVRVLGKIELRDRRNNKWPLDQVSFLNGGWGFDDEGVCKLPRPCEYDASGKEFIKGDRLAIFFPEGSRKSPFVIPGFRRIKATAGDFLPYSHERPTPGADVNRLAARLQPKDALGTALGSIDLEAAYGGKLAVRVSAGEPNGAGIRTFALLDQTNGAIHAGTKDGAQLRLAKGQVAIVSAEGHAIVLDSANGAQIAWKTAGDAADPMLNLKDGLALLISTLTQIVGSVELIAGDTNPANVTPLVVSGTETGGFFADLAAALGAAGTLIGGTNPCTDMSLKILAILAGTPASGYQSKTARSDG